MSKLSAFQLIGWTPLIEMKNIAKKDGINARLIGKIEPYQPLSSVKDRSALRLRLLMGRGETDFLGRVLIRGVCGWVETDSICQRVGAGWG